MREKYKEIMDQVKVSDTARSEILKNVLLAHDTESLKPLPASTKHRWQRGLIAAVCAGTAAAAFLMAVPALHSTVQYQRLESGEAVVAAAPSPGSVPAVQSAVAANPDETSASGLIVPLPQDTVPENHAAPAPAEQSPAHASGAHAPVLSPGSVQGQLPAEPLPAQTVSSEGGIKPAEGAGGGDIPDTGPASAEVAGAQPGGEELPPDPPILSTGGPLPSQEATYVPEAAPECSEGAVEATPAPHPDPPETSFQPAPTPTAVPVSSPAACPAATPATERPSEMPAETASQPVQSPSADPSPVLSE